MEKHKIDKPIPIDDKLVEFGTYLQINSRGILSARFGDGKSYFLSEFMDKNKSKYIFIPIYPVNYQVADNKDIFEYIKRDILIRLIILSYDDFEEIDIKKSLIIYSFILNNAFDLTLETMKFLPVINLNSLGFDLSKFTKAIQSISKKFKDYKDNIIPSEKDQANAFIEDLEMQKGSIYEFDVISQLICDIIDRIRAKKKKKVVLVIEDLDRIDPEHIFRILNIFSAHFDWLNVPLHKIPKGFTNKFKFDKVITVCDYDNIKKIYHHFYGAETDFQGYIHKFSSDKPYRYSYTEHLKYYISDNLPSFLNEFPNLKNKVTLNIFSVVVNKSPNINTSLRFLNNCLFSQSYTLTRNIKIQDGYSISSFNNFTRLLDLLRKLNIDPKNVLTNIQESVDFINENWLLLNTKNLSFKFIINEHGLSFRENVFKSSSMKMGTRKGKIYAISGYPTHYLEIIFKNLNMVIADLNKYLINKD